VKEQELLAWFEHHAQPFLREMQKIVFLGLKMITSA